MRKPCVILDIDGTIADLTHRRHYVTNGNRNWDAFFEEAGADAPIEEVIEVARSLHNTGHTIVVVSGRTADIRADTVQWLAENSVPYEELHMRPSGDYRPDHVVKKDILDTLREAGYSPWLAIDDRPSILELWQSEGIKTLACQSEDSVQTLPKRTPILQILVGPSGAGKSTWIEENTKPPFDTFKHSVVSSDDIRREICGSFHDQSRNPEVFQALHAVVKARLWSGLNACVDATNIRNKDRKALVALAPSNAYIQYIVIDRTLEEKYKTGGWRNELDFDLIAKHDQTFKANIRDILAGDGNPKVMVLDLRSYK